MSTYSTGGLAHMMLSHLEADRATFAELAAVCGVSANAKARRKAWYALAAMCADGLALHHRGTYERTEAGSAVLVRLRAGEDVPIDTPKPGARIFTSSGGKDSEAANNRPEVAA